jgi:DHA1 family tetracycline resistance protein-like MFS transporter
MTRRSPLLPIFLIVLVDVFGLTLVIPLLAIYAEHFGATPLQATMLVSTYAACQFISGPILGSLSDKHGRKPILIISQIGTFLGFLLMARAQVLWLIYVARVIDGLTAGNLTTAQAYISDNTRPEDRTKSFAIIGISFGVGFFVGPSVTGLLVGYGLNAPIYLAAALSMTSILCTTFLLPGGAPPQAHPGEDAGPGGRRPSPFDIERYAKYVTRPVLGGLYLQFFCFIFAFNTFTSGFALFAERQFTWDGHPFGVREIGYLFTYVGFLGIIIQGGLMGKLVKRLGEPFLVAFGFAGMTAGYGLLGFIHTVPPLVLTASISGIGNAILRPNLSSLITQTASRQEQGVAIGISQSLGSVAQILAPVLCGTLIQTSHLLAWAMVASSAACLGLLAGKWGSAKVPRPAPKATPQPAGS